MPHLSLHSPLGPLTVFEEEGALIALEWGQAPEPARTPLLAAAKRQLDAYFDGGADGFDLPLAPAGTPFQKRVWAAMRAVPRGEVRTYGELARVVGSAARAVGLACAANPLPIIVPCHRIVGAGGRLGGYSGGDGVDTKIALLRLEGAI